MTFPVKVSGEWRDIITAFAKQDGVWVKVYDTYTLIQFTNYPYKIPTMAGWQYSWDGVEWVDITYDMELNTIGYTFTGYVKAKNELNLNNHDSRTKGLRFDGSPLSLAREYLSSATIGDSSFVAGGRVGMETYYATVDMYDSYGVATKVSDLAGQAGMMTSGTAGNKVHFISGAIYNDSTWTVRRLLTSYDENGLRSTLTLPTGYGSYLASATNFNGNVWVFGGKTASGNTSTVFTVGDNSTITMRTGMSSERHSSCAFTLGDYAYTYGGVTPSGVMSKVGEKYGADNSVTTATYMSLGRSNLTASVLGNRAVICGGETDNGYTALVETLDGNGVISSATSLNVARASLTSFVMGDRLYVCGGTNGAASVDTVDVYDQNMVHTLGTPLSTTREALTSFVNNDKGFVCGGISYGSTNEHHATVDIYKDVNAIPVSAGSQYNLNGMTGIAENSGTIFLDDPVTGTVKYAKGTI